MPRSTPVDQSIAKLGQAKPKGDNPTPRKIGRPTNRVVAYDQAIADDVVTQVANGRTLGEICKSPPMPTRLTIFEWRHSNPEFRTAYERAREASADVMDEQILEAIRDISPQMANAVKVKIDALRWRAAHLNRARYGERQAVDIGAQTSLADLVMASIQITRQEADRLMAPTIEGEAQDVVVEPQNLSHNETDPAK